MWVGGPELASQDTLVAKQRDVQKRKPAPALLAVPADDVGRRVWRHDGVSHCGRRNGRAAPSIAVVVVVASPPLPRRCFCSCLFCVVLIPVLAAACVGLCRRQIPPRIDVTVPDTSQPRLVRRRHNFSPLRRLWAMRYDAGRATTHSTSTARHYCSNMASRLLARRGWVGQVQREEALQVCGEESVVGGMDDG